MPGQLDATADELAAAFRSELVELRRCVRELRQARHFSGSLDHIETVIDLVAARGANLCDVVTGARAVKPVVEAPAWWRCPMCAAYPRDPVELCERHRVAETKKGR